MYISIMGITNT